MKLIIQDIIFLILFPITFMLVVLTGFLLLKGANVVVTLPSFIASVSGLLLCHMAIKNREAILASEEER